MLIEEDNCEQVYRGGPSRDLIHYRTLRAMFSIPREALAEGQHKAEAMIMRNILFLSCMCRPYLLT